MARITVNGIEINHRIGGREGRPWVTFSIQRLERGHLAGIGRGHEVGVGAGVIWQSGRHDCLPV